MPTLKELQEQSEELRKQVEEDIKIWRPPPPSIVEIVVVVCATICIGIILGAYIAYCH